MTNNELVGKKLDIVLVDPWDFVTANGSGPFIADVVRSGHEKSTGVEALLLGLASSLKYKTEEYKCFVATTRHEGVTFPQLLSGIQVGCNLTGIPVERAHSANPLDLSWWRGGAAAIVDLRLHK
jgi:hypothetical protein